MKNNGTQEGIKEITNEIISIKTADNALTFQDLKSGIKDYYIQQIMELYLTF